MMHNLSLRRQISRWGRILGLGSLVLGGMGADYAQSFAAERFSIPFSGVRFNLTIKDLEVYAQSGKLQGELASYAQRATPAQMAELRQILQARINVPAFAVSQFLYSNLGETVLKSVGEDLRTGANQNGFYGLRSAFILAAKDPEGLSILNILRLVPGCCINVNSERVLAQFRLFGHLMEITTTAMTGLEARAAAEIKAIGPIDFQKLPDLRQVGPVAWQEQTITVTDTKRQRQFPVTVFLPAVSRPAPVMIISHGLGSDRNDFLELAKHLASYGLAVALPEHPGSNAQQRLAFLTGLEKQFIRPEEFIERPRDITALLDELTRLSQADPRFQGKINPNQAGAIGHSIGGQTVLSLAGANLNWEQIKQDCQQELGALSIAVPIQCSAMTLTPEAINLRDERIKGVIALNPIQRILLGQASLQQIAIPVMVVAGSDDVVTPAVLEQIEPFTWLQTPIKYLTVIQKGTHNYNPGIGGQGGGAIPLPAALFGPDPALARRYLNALSVAFAETHIANQAQFRPFLTPTYAQAISQPQLPLILVQGL
ncbi:alpha/beta hydrolase [Thermosynechococcaceae cyanobacterium BACA0444]|uniref:Alpha/beta hydrolase n=1 Tax=Pseudocalidococcus azoricus BACA0444 TaxID=2918990 RepID=A0AAE4FTK8_9CYAN|nr:alpha/beta hydrolase [Pseudocalidococcus azoricus]MDS3861931.1 alpha/beta hydrolase [Pseudocalidococcus azoricus BACA0444]